MSQRLKLKTEMTEIYVRKSNFWTQHYVLIGWDYLQSALMGLMSLESEKRAVQQDWNSYLIDSLFFPVKGGGEDGEGICLI